MWTYRKFVQHLLNVVTAALKAFLKRYRIHREADDFLSHAQAFARTIKIGVKYPVETRVRQSF